MSRRHWLLGTAEWPTLSRRLIVWTLFSVVIGLLPLSFVAFELWDSGKPHGLDDVLSGGGLVLVSIALAAGAVRELVSKDRGLTNFGLVNFAASLVVLVLGAWLYSRIMVRQREIAISAVQQAFVGSPHHANYTVISLAAFVLSFLLGASSIWLSTQEDEA